MAKRASNGEDEDRSFKTYFAGSANAPFASRADAMASPLFADGRIYFFSQEGRTTVIKPGSEYSELATSTLDSGFMASPAVAAKAMFLRTERHLYRVEK